MTPATERGTVDARGSSEKQEEAINVQRQKDRLVAAARDREYALTVMVTERASGLEKK